MGWKSLFFPNDSPTHKSLDYRHPNASITEPLIAIEKTRVKFVTNNIHSGIQIGFLMEDKSFESGYKVVASDGVTTYDISSLNQLDKI